MKSKFYLDSQKTIEEGLSQANNPLLCISGGKGSIVLLHMMRAKKVENLNVVYIYTDLAYPQVLKYLNKLEKIWGFRLNVIKTQGKMNISSDCCIERKILPLIDYVDKNQIDMIFLGTFDYKKIRSFKELCITNGLSSRFCEPFIHQSVVDINSYLLENSITLCSLLQNGYNDVDCQPCCSCIKNDVSETDESKIKEKLKKLGYL